MRMILVAAVLLAGCVRADETPQERAARHQRSLYLIGVGQQMMNPPRPVQCRTSDTSNPVTVCQ